MTGHALALQYVVWQADPAGGYCTLEELENVEDSFELKRGVARAHDFPDDACFRMDRAHPREIKLADNLWNLDELIVVSRRLRDFVEQKKPPSTEFLPIAIYNHKNRIASKDYSVINPFQVLDCIDQSKSTIEWNAIDPDLISDCTKLVLDEQNIDVSLPMFRPKYLPTIVLTRADFAEMIQAQGFTGLDFVPVAEFET